MLRLPSSLWAAWCLLVLFSVTRVAAEIPAFINDWGYDQEAYGRHPLQKYRSVDLEVPRFNILKSSPKCDDSLYTFFAPRGWTVRNPQITIVDQEGHLIWTTPFQGQQLYDLMVQEYKGEKYLTFWAGNDAVGGHGAGFIHMFDKHYNEFKKIAGAEGKDADLHDFRITPEGTALVTVYQNVPRDLESMGKPKGPVWDCLIQEIDIETGDLVFEWRATDHWNFTDSYREIGGEGEGNTPWDWFHMNSIDKDPQGNYLVSSRYMRSLTYVNGTDGSVIWVLGGKRNMFKDLSKGRATDFKYQHDARFADDYTTITMFDNGIDDAHRDLGPTRGLKLRVNEKDMTVELVQAYHNPHKITGKSQGSFQSLDNGNVLLGYGDTAAWTEFAADGTALCDVHFGTEIHFGESDVMSYRVYKFAWQGWPLSEPDSVIDQDDRHVWKVYTSWNGATEVAKWTLQGSDKLSGSSTPWSDLDTIRKTTFETEFELRYWYPAFLRVVAIDVNGTVLATGKPLNSSLVDQPWKTQTTRLPVDQDWVLRLLLVCCTIISLGMVVGMGLSIWRSYRE